MRSQHARDAALRAAFAAPGGPTRESYELLVRYLLTGFLARSGPGFASARYRGLPSCNGTHADRMEGFSRLAPLLAACVRGGRSSLETLDGRVVDLCALLGEALAAGSDPGAAGFWGALRDDDQRTCEAADIALAVWLARDLLEDVMTPPAYGRLLDWLAGGVERRVTDNNWHLFPATIATVLQALGQAVPEAAAEWRLKRIAAFAAGDGLFRDGAAGAVDWYNAWGFHYHLGWIEAIGAVDLGVLGDMRRAAIPLWLRLIAPTGVPIFGRSLHYRMAAPAPLTIAAMLGGETGQPRRALDLVWTHFTARGAVAGGGITQGYLGRADPKWVDAYAGPASGFWSLRSLIPVLALPAEHDFWTAAPAPLPVETGDYEVRCDALGATILGDEASGVVRIRRGRGVGSVRPERLTLRRQLAGRLRGYIARPANKAARYGLREYASAPSFVERLG